jgi:phage terminase large subunit-like protein
VTAGQLALGVTGELAHTETFPRLANRAKSVGIIRRAEWEAWKGSRVGRYIKFTEKYCIAPVVRRPVQLHTFQRDMYERWLDPNTRADMEKIGRGNAKTTTLGGFVTTGLFLEQDGDVPIVATTVKQAEKTVYGCVVSMVEAHPELAARAHKFTSVADKRLYIPQTNSVVYPMADLPSALQGLNPSVPVLDEASEASIDTWDALALASGKRPDSIVIGVSTPSFKLDGNAMLAFEQALAGGVQLPGNVFHAHAAPDGCDYRDESMWQIANPGLLLDCGCHHCAAGAPPILYIDALRAEVGRVGEQKFRCYRLAQWPTMILEGWLGEDGPELWRRLEDPYDLVRKAPTWAGVDVSLRYDSTAVVLVQQRPDGRWHAVAKVWYPGDGVVDQAEVREHLRRASIDFDLQGVGYDPRFFEASAQDLYAEGLPMIEIPQTPSRMVPAVATTYRAIVSGAITHDADPVFEQHVVNAQARPSEGGITLSKNPKLNALKIDACIALVHAISLADVRAGELSLDQLMIG